jgi:hypothetical protein
MLVKYNKRDFNLVNTSIISTCILRILKKLFSVLYELEYLLTFISLAHI